MNKNINNKLENLDLNKSFYLQNLVCFAIAKRDIALEYQNLGKYKEALYHFEDVLQIQKLPYYRNNFTESELVIKISETLYSMEILHNKLGLFQKALGLANLRLLSYKQTNNVTMIEVSSTMSTIAHLYEQLKKYDYALYYFWQSFNIRSLLYKGVDSYNISDDEYTALSDLLNTIEFVYFEAGYYTEALSLCEMRLNSYQEIYDRANTTISDTMTTMATLYEAIGKYQDSLYYLREAISIDNQISRYIGPEILYDLQSKINYYENNFMESRDTTNLYLRDEASFFESVALGLELSQRLSNLLRLEVVKYITNNAQFFFEFSDAIYLEINDFEREGFLTYNLYTQGIADLFCVNIAILDQNDNEFLITSRTDSNSSRIYLLYNGHSYEYIVSDNLTINNYFTILTDQPSLIGNDAFW